MPTPSLLTLLYMHLPLRALEQTLHLLLNLSLERSLAKGCLCL
uniref:Uncharacterized protein n=1 Tax=Picea glauca TaxID=3330 RepID=A0A117NHG4_PICGL|nr:hypothetical protein ABT39_MTgene5307 [Picea glauca]QHR88884.1 hypothetical protein Q903MT_gene2903 [Picea sitchensis]